MDYYVMKYVIDEVVVLIQQIMHLFYIMVEMHFQDQEHRLADHYHQWMIADLMLILCEYEDLE
jgi:hypothetical protein